MEPQSIEIKTYFHFMAISATDSQSGTYYLPHPTGVALSYGKTGEYTTHDEMVAMCRRQVEIMNDAFADTPFYYTFQSNPSISTNIDYTNYPMDYQQEMRETIGVADPTALNIYLSFSLGSQKSDTTGFVGIADFPFFQQQGGGLFMRYDVLPGGGLPGNDDGYIGELSKWLFLKALRAKENILQIPSQLHFTMIDHKPFMRLVIGMVFCTLLPIYTILPMLATLPTKMILFLTRPQ